MSFTTRPPLSPKKLNAKIPTNKPKKRTHPQDTKNNKTTKKIRFADQSPNGHTKPICTIKEIPLDSMEIEEKKDYIKSINISGNYQSTNYKKYYKHQHNYPFLHTFSTQPNTNICLDESKFENTEENNPYIKQLTKKIPQQLKNLSEDPKSILNQAFRLKNINKQELYKEIMKHLKSNQQINPDNLKKFIITATQRKQQEYQDKLKENDIKRWSKQGKLFNLLLEQKYPYSRIKNLETKRNQLIKADKEGFETNILEWNNFENKDSFYNYLKNELNQEFTTPQKSEQHELFLIENYLEIITEVKDFMENY